MCRDANGQFAKGNAGGPGRPRRATEADYLRISIEAVSLDDWREIVARAASDAKGGDRNAREFLRRILIGDALPSTVLTLAGGTPEMCIVYDPNFFGNAERVAAVQDPSVQEVRAQKLQQFLARVRHEIPDEYASPLDGGGVRD